MTPTLRYLVRENWAVSLPFVWNENSYSITKKEGIHMTHKENLAEKEVTTTQLASIIGLTARRVRQLSQDGVLVSSSPGKYILSDAVQAYIGSLARGGMTKEEAEEAKKIDRIKANAEATLKESKAKIAQAEAKELSGQMHRSEDVAAMTSELIYTIRGALMARLTRLRKKSPCSVTTRPSMRLVSGNAGHGTKS